ncbi:MAG: putative quinol monooxygenase [Spirochaetales bacterium]|uniref:Quinol monooxygenase n=1 Tax=Candidatus Thalassospirochaeta sargassi TaxID=3119039 RepID=A0AAJ1MM06_9SPIO|nr:putative quinol monooxygenase [Spirochaetales bacterium]
MVLIIAKLKVKAGLAEAFIEKTKPLIAGSNAEKGCIEYILYRNHEDSSLFHMVEKWKDMEAIKAHQAAPHYVNSGVSEFIEESEITLHDPV